MKLARLIQRFVRLASAGVVTAVAATTPVHAQEGGTFEVFSTFDVAFIAGNAPSSAIGLGTSAVYGTASEGGSLGKGTLFALSRNSSTGVTTVAVRNFFNGMDGARPFGLVLVPDGGGGRFYGLTSEGGTFGFGTVFRHQGSSGDVRTLHAFSQSERSPVDLVATSGGTVYGLTAGGGDFGNGTIFAIDPSDNFRTRYSFPPSAGAGMTSLVRGSDGRFYGTAGGGGDAGFGTVFTVDDAGTLTVLHSFAGRAQGDGETPVGLIQGRDGRLYGTTRSGGQFGDGTVYSIDLTGDYRVLHGFNASVDGAQPESDLLHASDGNFYGVTRSPTASRLFRIDSSGNFTPLNDLTGFSPGALSEAGGRLFIPTAAGGIDNGGTVLAKDLAETALTLFFDFTVGQGAAGSPNGIIQSRNGLFYGTSAPLGAPGNVRTLGTVFVMDAAGERTTLHTFDTDISPHTDASTPRSNLFEGADGNFYGTTNSQGQSGTPPGQVYTLTPAGDLTTIASAYNLQDGVIQARDGRLYGVTSIGLENTSTGRGTVFRVEADGTLTVLHRFDGTDTDTPLAELLETNDGSLYGVTSGGPSPQSHGTIFRVDPATGLLTIVYRFRGPDGSKPLGRLTRGTDGLIYGTTSNGGVYGSGTVFSFDSAGALTTLHHFAGTDGGFVGAGVIQGLDGRLYGTTSSGGAFGRGPLTGFGFGTVFALNVAGGLTTLHDFTGADGASPVQELIQATDGAIYGAAPVRGPNLGGVIFRVHPDTTPPDRYFQIVSRASGKCLDVSGASTDPAAPVIQWTCHGGPNQQWRIEPDGAGAHRIISRHSGQSLDVYGALVDDLAAIIQYPAHGGDNQLWRLQVSSNVYHRIIAKHSGKAMDVEGASLDDGARVIQYTLHGGTNQEWLLVGVQ